MAQTYGNDLKLSLITPGTESGTWGGITNNNLKQIVKGMGGYKSVTVSGTSHTISTSDDVSQDLDFRQLYLNITGSSSGAFTLNLPAIQKVYIVKNGINHDMTVKLTGESGSGVTIAQGKVGIVYLSGTNALAAIDSFPAADFTGTLAVANGGTGLTSVTSGAVLVGNGTGAFTVRTGSSTNDVLTWNGSTWVSQAPAAGSGTVTSVSGSGQVNGIQLSGTVTTSGTLTLSAPNGITGVVKTDSSGALQSVNGNFQINKSTPILFLGTATSGSYYGFNESGGQVNLVSSGSVQLGLISSQVAVGNHMIPSTDNTYDLGTGSFRYRNIYASSGTVNNSDQRMKNSIQDTDLGLSFVNALTPRKYKMNDGTATLSSSATDTSFAQYTYSSGTRFHYGLISQEVATVLDNQGVDKSLFGGWTLDDPSDPDSRQSLRYQEFIAPMIKAIQELSAKVDALEQRVQQLESN